tara:strand:- start:425 stop:763 length:339 start_codon:yes stop_codon:yes gene_type:complete
MKLGSRIERKEKKDPHIFQKIILYFLVIAFAISFISSIVISLLLVGSKHDMSIKIPGTDFVASTPERPVLGQFGPISTVILIIGIPFLILITLIAYAFYISVEGIKDKLSIF